MNIALIGYGTMGRQVEAVLAERGHRVGLVVDADNPQDLCPEKLRGIDAAIEFTTPATAFGNVTACLRAGIPVVCGTTGWNDRFSEARRLCEETGGTFFYASNFSVGVNVMFRVNEYLARIMDAFPEYEVAMREIHHTRKKDSPSGTAVTLAEGIMANMERKMSWVNEDTLEPSAIGIVSVREGDVPGTHTVKYTSAVDEIELTHKAYNRRGLALGAVLAAEFTQGRKGVLSMDDLLQI